MLRNKIYEFLSWFSCVRLFLFGLVAILVGVLSFSNTVYAQQYTVTVPGVSIFGIAAPGTYPLTIRNGSNQGKFTSYPYPFTGRLSRYTTKPFFNTTPRIPPKGGVGPLDAGATSRLYAQRGPKTSSWTSTKNAAPGLGAPQ